MRDHILVTDPPYDALDTASLRARLRATKMERARAIGALARRAAREPQLVEEVLELLASEPCRQYRTMGSISLAHIGVASLWLASEDALRARIRSLINAWPEPDRTDLRWFLVSQEINLSAIEETRVERASANKMLVSEERAARVC